MASLAMWVDSTRTTLGSPLGLTMRLRYEQGDLPLVPDLSTLVEEAVVDPLSVSELVDGAEKRANALGSVLRLCRPDGRMAQSAAVGLFAERISCIGRAPNEDWKLVERRGGRGSSSVWPAGLRDGYWRRKLRDSGAACRPGRIFLS